MKKEPNLSDIVISILKKDPGKELSPRALAERVFDKHKDLVEKRRKTPNSTRTDGEVLAQITSEIRGKQFKTTPSIQRLEDPPRFHFIIKSEESPPLPKSRVINTNKLLETTLYEKLREYLLQSVNIYSMRLDERVSSNPRPQKRNYRLHPDIVGIEVLGEKWIPEVRVCVHKYHGKKIRLSSFEVKKDTITRGNIRRLYENARTNSSWANLGYLVAPRIEPDAREELDTLFDSHGIGFIELNIENPIESQIITKAKERPEINWNAVNRIANENKPFKEYYVGQIQAIYETLHIRWDMHPWSMENKN